MLRDFQLGIIVEPLLTWFQGHARVLPWREEPTPYRVWVSAIMLPQPRVEAVAAEAVGGAGLLQPCPEYADCGKRCYANA